MNLSAERKAKIVKQLNGIRAKAYDKSIANTPEAINALEMFNSMMIKYNLELSDLDVKESKVTGITRTFDAKDFMKYLVIPISKLTNTTVVPVANKGGKRTVAFLGIISDVEYANWAYDLISNSIENASIAYKISLDYHKRINKGEKGAKLMEAFSHGFIHAIYTAIEAMNASNASTSNALVPVKNALVEQFMEDQGIPTPKIASKAVTIQDTALEVAKKGIEAGNGVILRKGIN